jgi:serine acetyltransferase
MQKTSYSGANVCIYANATILGNTVIGNSIIGGNSWVTKPFRQVRLSNHNNRSKNKRTKIAWSLKKLLDLIEIPLGRKRQFD